MSNDRKLIITAFWDNRQDLKKQLELIVEKGKRPKNI
jgi:hypothetical protein